MTGLPGLRSRKKLGDIFIGLDTVRECNGRVDTGQQQVPRLRIASRGENHRKSYKSANYVADQCPHVGAAHCAK